MRKRLISILLALTMVTGILMTSGCEFKNKYVTRGEWITMLSETFGMDSYTEDTPAYSDVTSESDIFTYIQSAAEWNVLSIFDGEKLNATKAVTRKEAASTAAIAAGYKFEDGAFSADASITYAVDNGIIPNNKKLSGRMTVEECEEILALACTAYMNAPIEERMVVVTNSNVIDMTNLSDKQIKVSESKVTATGSVSKDSSGKITATIETPAGSANVSVGDVFITPPTPENPAGIAHKAISIEEADGEVIINTEVPELGDIYDELDVSTMIEANLDNIIWAPEFSDSIEPMSFENGKREYSISLDSTRNVPNIVPLGGKASYSTSYHKDFVFPENGGNFKYNWTNQSSSVIGSGEGAQELTKSRYVYNGTPSIEDFNGTTDPWTKKLIPSMNFKGGYKITGSFDINSLTLKTELKNFLAKVDYASVQVDADISASLKLEGNLGGSLKIGTVPIPIAASGLSVTVELYLYVSASGSLEVGASINSSAKVEYSKFKLKHAASSEMNAYIDAAIDINFGADLSATLEAFGWIKVIDAGVKVGGNISATAQVNGSCKVSEEDGVSKLTYQESMLIKSDLYVPLITIYAGGKGTLAEKFHLGGSWDVTTKNKGAKHINLMEKEWVFWEETVLLDENGDATGESETITAGEKDGIGATDEDRLDFKTYVITLKDDSKLIELDLDIGETAPAVVWTSDNTSVATVDGDGVVRPVNKGYTIITAHLISDPSVYVKCAVYVEKFGEGNNGENNGWEFLPPDLPTAA